MAGDCYAVVSVASAGGSLTLHMDDSYIGYKMLAGMTGVGVAPVSIDSLPVADGDGSVGMSQRLAEREMFFPVRLKAQDAMGLWDLRRQLEKVLMPGRGTVNVSIYNPLSGETRTCRGGYYTEGLEGGYATEDATHTYYNVPLKFRFTDPFAYGDTITIKNQLSPDMTPWLSEDQGFLGEAVVYPSNVGGEYEVDSYGDLPSFVRIVVTGPGTDLKLENKTTGQKFTLLGDIVAPTTIERTRTRKILSDGVTDRADLWARVPKESAWLTLAPGKNKVSVSMVNADTNTDVSFRYEPTFLALM